MTNKTERHFTYEVESGIFTVRNGDDVKRIGKGYSGQPPFVNQPSSETLVAAGPIPRGEYRVHWPFRHVRLGPLAFFLEPLDGTKMHGRSGFFIHGDNALGNRTASHGCIILSRTDRAKIEEHLRLVRTLKVV